MKQISYTVGCICLVFTMLAASFSSAVAANPSPDLPDPKIEIVSGNPDVKVKMIGTANLPGVTHTDSGMLIPAGFPVGEKQFEGNGIQISKLNGGTVNVCFPYTGTQYGWGGQVGKWTGSRWQILPTTTTTQAESSISYACTSVSSDGTYTFLKWVVDPSKIPAIKTVCGYNLDGVDFSSSTETETDEYHDITVDYFYIYTTGDLNLEGKTVTLSIKNVTPEGKVSMEPVTGTLHKTAEDEYTLTPALPVHLIVLHTTSEDEYWTVLWLLDFGNCEDTTETYFYY